MLERARDLGFLGPGPVEAHLDHAEGFVEVVAGRFPAGPGMAADLGSGAGLPGLVLALAFPDCGEALVESSVRRARFLRGAVEQLELGERVSVVEERAEVVGRATAYRGRCDVVVARGFGPPAVVAECGAPLLRVGGCLVVSEPPGGRPTRWPVEHLDTLGMRPEAGVVARSGGSFQVIGQVAACPDRYPRRVGVPGKRPLF